MELMPEKAEDSLICVQTTVDDAKAAQRLARGLVDARLAACVQVGAIASTYVWDGAAVEAGEQLLTIKTVRGCLAALEAWLGEHHPYAEPEILVLPVEAASAGYAGWVRASLG